MHQEYNSKLTEAELEHLPSSLLLRVIYFATLYAAFIRLYMYILVSLKLILNSDALSEKMHINILYVL